ncbi:MAG TPA: hypothetical protein VLF20_06230, partial [Patescibacteria group bacterium]|nr:hypothetical protein [Patescibacteria group bacterium]
MKKIIFYSMPGHGHVHPTVNVARELAKRGYKVIYYGTDEFKSYIEHAGLIYRRYADDPDFDGSVIKDLGKLLKLISGIAIRQVPYLIEEARKENPDIIVHDSLAIGGKIVAHVLKKSGVSLSTTLAYSRKAFFLYPSFTKQVIASMVSSSANIFQAWKNYVFLGEQYGLRIKGLGDMLMHKEKVNIVFLTKYFQPFSNSFDKSFYFVGPSIYPRLDQSNF